MRSPLRRGRSIRGIMQPHRVNMNVNLTRFLSRHTVLLTSLCLALLLSLGAKAVEVRVSISNLKFKPAVIQIEPGDTVTWVNEDDADHTVTADDKSFKSGNLGAGKSFSQKFEK